MRRRREQLVPDGTDDDVLWYRASQAARYLRVPPVATSTFAEPDPWADVYIDPDDSGAAAWAKIVEACNAVINVRVKRYTGEVLTVLEMAERHVARYTDPADARRWRDHHKRKGERLAG